MRAYAINSAGTAYGADRTFTTLQDKPQVSSVVPSSGPPGITVTITGKNFGASRTGGSGSSASASEFYVTFGGVRGMLPDGQISAGAETWTLVQNNRGARTCTVGGSDTTN